jgi:predicted nucleic acid-binding Zn ribbon protein
MAKGFDSLKKQITETADKLATSSNKVRKKMTGVSAHKHCRMCQSTIPMKADPAICKAEACDAKWAKEEKSRKSLKMWMTIFIGFFAFAFIGPIVQKFVF